jgi:hypothetical protein
VESLSREIAQEEKEGESSDARDVLVYGNGVEALQAVQVSGRSPRPACPPHSLPNRSDGDHAPQPRTWLPLGVGWVAVAMVVFRVAGVGLLCGDRDGGGDDGSLVCV